jgi:transcription elongation factor GreA-like protein
MPRMPTCRDEVLNVVRAVVRNNGRNEFTADEIVKRLRDSGSTFAESTIRAHVTSRCCLNAAKNFVVTYEDFERVRPGIYRMI